MARLSEVIGRYVAPPGAAPPAEDEIGEGDEAGEGLEEEGELVEEEEEEELEVFYQGGAKVQEETLVAASVPPDATDAPLPPGDNLEAPPPDQINASQKAGSSAHVRMRCLRSSSPS